MYIIYKTDNWHSYASREIIGITSNEALCLTICNKQAKKEGEKLDKDQINLLNKIQQTQGYSGEGEFQYEYLQEDVLL